MPSRKLFGIFALALALALGPTTALADTAPSVTVAPVTEITFNSAELSGTVNPNGGPSTTFWQLQYSQDPENEGWGLAESGEFAGAQAEETNPLPVSASLGALQPAHTYFVRLVAVNEGDEAISAEPYPSFETVAVNPPIAALDPVTTVTDHTAHFSGTVNSGGSNPGEAGEYRFECSPECPGLPGFQPFTSDGADQAVQANAADLEPNTEYLLSLIATNAGNEARAEGAFTTTALAPTIEAKAASSTSDGATLRAQINPHNSPTTYHFEWGADTTYGHSLPAGAEAALGSTANTPAAVSQQIIGLLTPATTYHFRVLATNSVQTVAGPDRTFTTSALPVPPPPSDMPGRGFLPDSRAWEQVSPVDKNGGDVLLESARTRAASSGDMAQFSSLTGFGDVHGTAISTDYMAERGAGGWSTHGITPRQEPLSSFLVFNGPGDVTYEGDFSDDFTHGVVRANASPYSSPNVSTVQNLFLRNDLLAAGPGAWSLVSDSTAPLPPSPIDGSVASTYRPAFAGASSDFGHIIFESSFNLTQQAIDAGLPTAFLRDEKLYEWDHGTLRLVGILPESEGGGPATRSLAGRGASRTSPYYTADAISDDGSRIFFAVPNPDDVEANQSDGKGQLYLRENASETIHLNVFEGAGPDPGPNDATFSGATPDGSMVFFESAAILTDGASGGGLYRYDVDAPAGEHLTLISEDQDPSDESGGRALSMVGTSDDGSWVYFVAIDSRMVPGSPVADGLTRPVLYRWHNGELKYVAKLGNTSHDIYGNSTSAQWQFGSKTGHVTPDGKHLLFLSFEGDQVVPHDHGDCSAVSIGSTFACHQAYVYSAQANGGEGELSCASCAPSGAPGSADAGVTFRGSAGAARTTSHLNHPLTDDGRWAFFGTSQALLPEDRNTSLDVYRYELASGDLRLLSSGNPDAGDAYFMDASASGDDVFFATREQLVGQDNDASYDLYDARVGGGFASQNPPPLPPTCLGDTCRGAGGPLPAAANVASSTYQGRGNAKSQRHRKRKHRKRHHKHARTHAAGKRGHK